MSWAGAVLAGGQSRRMGFDKALLAWEGRPLWQRQLGLLAQCGADPAALVRQPGQSDLGAPCWRDRRVGQGPLAGLETALWHAQAAGAEAALILAVDMPYLSAEWFRWLRAEAPAGGVARHDGRYEPLAAVYPAAALPIVAAQLDAGRLALQSLLEVLIGKGLMSALAVPSALASQVRSVNSPAACPSITAK